LTACILGAPSDNFNYSSIFCLDNVQDAVYYLTSDDRNLSMSDLTGGGAYLLVIADVYLPPRRSFPSGPPRYSTSVRRPRLVAAEVQARRLEGKQEQAPMTTTKRPSDRSCLRFAGLLGHPFVVVCDDGDGGRRTSCECTNISSARRFAAEDAAKGRNPTIYCKADDGTWNPTE
jgi:hypothetical protein